MHIQIRWFIDIKSTEMKAHLSNKRVNGRGVITGSNGLMQSNRAD